MMQVPSDDEFVDAFGVAPEAEDEPWIKVVRIEDVLVSFDEHAASVRVRWFQGDEPVVDLYREDANRLRVWSGDGESHVAVDFGDGEMRVRIHPSVRITSRHN
ncbi:hypothetical protein C8D88_10971 [Lentzea atacamensis]|uniref:Uncharacterized protein n=2 Tax=Lentzea TaxID=165301 RepID=A0A316I0P9_9PSEU|nr:hypothetical protein [Lentzea atacamensis]PWK83987.1 hypothetical protein C8D88_10971 [Lentzea atacamensis]RAS68853.1 hypothetical protein C8D87_102930 [Lentzea atacamensis]